jgi:hypothetical protein
VPGEVLIQRGQRVEPLQVIARAELTRRYRVIDVARQLAQSRVDMSEVLLKTEGSSVEANEPIATSQGGLPFLRRVARAPAAGQIAAIGPGWVLLETERTIIELQAFVNGVVSKIIPNRGAVIEASGAIITASCGVGGEAYGPLKRLVNGPFEALQAEAIDESLKKCILLGGRSLDEEVLRTAEAAQVRGIIVGSIDAALIRLDPTPKVRVVATEGFGDVPMSPYTFGILGTLAGNEVSIRGNTPTLFPASGGGDNEAPPIILATSSRASSRTTGATSADEQAGPAVEVGSRVRVTRGRLLGASGTIDSIPSEPQATESGVVAPGAQVMIDDALHYVPWANLEQVN